MQLKLVSLLLILFVTISFASNERGLFLKKYKNEAKTALVIGNSQYKYFSKLKNSKNDAYDIQKVLASQGFDVLYLKEGSLRDMKKIIRKFTKKLSAGGVGFFYYAGHGVEVDGRNYLIPTDANIPEKNEVEYESLAINMLIDKMEESGNRLNIVVLDACRNDPFSRSGGGGLAQINNAKGMYISYATAPGKVASDGKGRNGLFTKYLIRNIKKPNLTLNEVFKKTRISVYRDSNDKQLPWTSSSVMGDFYFKIDKNLDYQKTIKNREKSSFNFSNEKPTTFSLTIQTKPSNAKVQIMNIKDKYYDGIQLKKGKYKIKVSKNGYISRNGDIDLKNDLKLTISLDTKYRKNNINSGSKASDNRYDINRFSSLKPNDSVDDLIEFIGEPFQFDKKKDKYPFYSADYIEKYGPSFSFYKKNRKLYVINVKQKHVKAMIKLGIKDNKLMLLGKKVDYVKSKFKNCEFDGSHLECKSDRNKISFLCYSFWNNECREFSIYWFKDRKRK
ncbi:MAG: caspase family protein [Campylobacterota bacterium]|nr:caspase family protein [Campylobacterota bacterium]